MRILSGKSIRLFSTHRITLTDDLLAQAIFNSLLIGIECMWINSKNNSSGNTDIILISEAGNKKPLIAVSQKGLIGGGDVIANG